MLERNLYKVYQILLDGLFPFWGKGAESVFSRIICSYDSGYCLLIEDEIWAVLVKIH